MPSSDQLSHGPYTARLLPPDEWDAKADQLLHYPALPDPAGTILVVVEDSNGCIVATWYAVNTVHFDGLYIDPAHRLNPAVARVLFDTLTGECVARGIAGVLTHTADPSILALARKRGFEIIPGTMCQLALPLGPR